MGTTVTTDVKVKPGGIGTSGPGGFDGDGPEGPGPGGPGRWAEEPSREAAFEPNKYRIGMWVALAGILMLFMALTSAYIVRQTPQISGGPGDWGSIRMPGILWLNTAVIVASSAGLEVSRRLLRRGEYQSFRWWLAAATLLGLGFLAGQVAAWQQLVRQGVYMDTNPHSSFFYLLTSLHAVHLLGGIVALTVLTLPALRLRITVKRRAALGVTAIYWHFMAGLWVYLLLLLFFWK